MTSFNLVTVQHSRSRVSRSTKVAVVAVLLVAAASACGQRASVSSGSPTATNVSDIPVSMASTSLPGKAQASTTSVSPSTGEPTGGPCYTEFEVLKNGGGLVSDEEISPSAHVLDGFLVLDLIQSGERIGRGCTDAFKADPAAVYAAVTSGPTRMFVTLVTIGRPVPMLEHASLIEVSTLDSGIDIATFEVTDRTNFVATGVQGAAALEASVRDQKPQGSATIVLSSQQ